MHAYALIVCCVNWWTFAVTAGAVIRLTRLITHDTITAPLRAAAARYDVRNRLALHKPPHPGPGPALSFVTCPWCISIYVAGVLFAAYGLAPVHCRGALTLTYAALTASWLAGTALANNAPARPAGPPRGPVKRPPAPPTPPDQPAPAADTATPAPVPLPLPKAPVVNL